MAGWSAAAGRIVVSLITTNRPVGTESTTRQTGSEVVSGIVLGDFREKDQEW